MALNPIIISHFAHRGSGLCDWLLPRRCIECGARADRGPDLCKPCRDRLPHAGLQCPRCAAPTAATAACGQCLSNAPHQHAVFAPFTYRAPLDHWIRCYKYRAQHHIGRSLAELLVMEWQCRGLCAPEALIPVPLHPRRLARRGFNQSFEIARDAGRALTIAVRPDLLRRVRHGCPQAELSFAARTTNIRGVFRCQDAAGLRHVALVDDVMTSGGTIGECARVLRRAGVERVEAWVIARA